jgi:hypothetical protein
MPKTYEIADVEVSGAAWGPGRAWRSFPNKNEQGFSPKIVEKNPAKMEKILYLICSVPCEHESPPAQPVGG